MKQKITAALALVLAGLSFNNTMAQQAMGLIAGNHNAPYSAFQNPANTMPDLNRMYINFWGANVGFTSNFLTYNAPFRLIPWANGNYPDAYKNSNGSLNFNQDWIQWGKANNSKLYYLDEVYGPSVFVRASRNVGFGFGIRSVSGISMTGVGSDLSRLFRFGLDSTSQTTNGSNALALNKKYSNGPFSINIDNYQEWFFSLAGVTKRSGPDYLKWGATGKLLLGTGSAHLGANSLDFMLKGNNQIQLSNGTANFSHTSDQSLVDGLSHPLGLNFNEINGAGAGFDLGFMYEYRPQQKTSKNSYGWDCYWNNKTQYDWKFGASITDIGLINYFNGTSRKLDMTNPVTWQLNNQTVNQNLFQAGDDRFARADKGFFDDSAIKAGVGGSYVVTTPMALTAQFDMNLGGNVFFGVNWLQSLKGQNSMGLRKASYLSLVPRWEGEHVEVGMPVTLSRDYTALNVGLYGRVGPFILGTDNLAGLAKYVSNSSYKAANVYFAVRMQLPTCGWYHYDTYDSIRRDTVTKTDSVDFWKSDSVRVVHTDTIIKKEIVRDTVKSIQHDTVYRYQNTVDPTLRQREQAAKQKEAQLKQKEADLKMREDDLKRREEEMRRKPNPGQGTNDCSVRIASLEDQLSKEKAKYNQLSAECTDERNRQAAKITDLENQIIALRKINNDQNAENNELRNKILVLQQEIDRLKVTNKPCDRQVKTLDSLLKVEQGKTAQLSKDLSTQKALVTSKDAEIAANKKRIAELETELATVKANCNNTKACDDKIKQIQTELDNEKAKTAELNKTVVKISGQNDSLSKENSTLKAKVTAGETDNANLKKLYDQLKKEYDFEIAENQKLRDQLKNCGSSDEAAKLKADLDASNKKIAELNTQLAKVQAQNDDLTKENATLKAKVTAGETDNATLKKQYDDLKKEYDFEIAENQKLRDQLKNCGSSDEAAKLKADLDASNKKVAELNTQLAKAQGQNDDLTKENSTLKGKVTQLQTDVDGLKKQLDDANAKIADLNDKLKNCGDADALAKAKADLATANAKVADLQDKLDAATKAKAAAEADLSTAKAKIADLEDQLSKCKEGSNCDDIQTQFTESKNKYNNLKAEYDALLSDRNKIKADLADCKTALANCNSSNTSNDDLKAEIEKLKATIIQLNGDVANKQKSLDDLQDAYDKLQGQNKDMAAKIADLQAQVKSLNAQVTDLQAKLKACQDANPPSNGGGGN